MLTVGRWRRVPGLRWLCLALLCCLGALSPASARPWKPTPTALAQDYLLIVDQRSDRDIAMVLWLAAPMVANSREVAEILDKYAVVGVLHAHFASDGTAKFDDFDSLHAQDGEGRSLKLLRGDAVPPIVAGVVSTVGAAMQQTLGPMGHGLHWFIFAGGAVHACGKGQLAVLFAGETYTYKSPVPGCPQA
jgi:hypothetical protein